HALFRSDSGENGVSGDGTLPGWRLFPGVLALFVVHLSITAVHPVLPGFLETIMEEPVRVASLAGQIPAAGALAAAPGPPVGGQVPVRPGVWATVVVALSVAGLASLPQAAVSSVSELFVLRLVADF